MNLNDPTTNLLRRHTEYLEENIALEQSELSTEEYFDEFVQGFEREMAEAYETNIYALGFFEALAAIHGVGFSEILASGLGLLRKMEQVSLEQPPQEKPTPAPPPPPPPEPGAVRFGPWSSPFSVSSQPEPTGALPPPRDVSNRLIIDQAPWFVRDELRKLAALGMALRADQNGWTAGNGTGDGNHLALSPTLAAYAFAHDGLEPFEGEVDLHNESDLEAVVTLIMTSHPTKP